MKILAFIIGTRPEYIKLVSIIKQLQANQKVDPIVLFTGQHKDISPSAMQNCYLSNSTSITLPPNPQTTNPLPVLQAFYIEQITKMLKGYSGAISGVVVQGDTTSAFCGAIAAFNLNIPIHHVEAGLRTFQTTPHPEEGYRRMISQIATYHYCPTLDNVDNIMQSTPAYEENIFLTGNPGLDLLDKTNCHYGDEVIITLHRHETRHDLPNWILEIDKLAAKHKDLTFTLIHHPNPRVQDYCPTTFFIKESKPLPHDQFIQRIKQCRFLISDSGGIQEEACFFNKKVIVCRTSTERPEGIRSGHLHLCKSYKDLPSVFNTVNQSYQIDSYCPFGDGNSAQKISNLMESICLA